MMDVLLVDDSEDLRELVALVIQREPGWHVVGEAGDGREAIRLAGELAPDLVLLDMAMPVMDGLTALPHLRTRLPDATIVVLTAFPRDQVWGDARARGADGCVEKSDVVSRLRPQLIEILNRGRVPTQPAGGLDDALTARSDVREG